MNKKFTWKLIDAYTSKGPYLWESDVIALNLYGFHESSQPKASATYTARLSGPNTAYAQFVISFDHFSNKRFGYSIAKHFRGPNAHLKARAWCNWLLNNSPNYCREFSYTPLKEKDE